MIFVIKNNNGIPNIFYREKLLAVNDNYSLLFINTINHFINTSILKLSFNYSLFLTGHTDILPAQQVF